MPAAMFYSSRNLKLNSLARVLSEISVSRRTSNRSSKGVIDCREIDSVRETQFSNYSI